MRNPLKSNTRLMSNLHHMIGYAINDLLGQSNDRSEKLKSLQILNELMELIDRAEGETSLKHLRSKYGVKR